MDILSVRRKALAQRQASVTASTHDGAPPEQSPVEAGAAPAARRTLVPSSLSATEPPAASRDDGAVGEQSFAWTQTQAAEREVSRTTSPRKSALPAPVDPLQGFLAEDDLMGSDDEGVVERATTEALGQRYLAFRLGEEEYAVNIMDVREIRQVRNVTVVPRAPRDVLGIVSRRGVVVPLVDLGASLGLRPPDRSSRPQQRALVVGDGDRACCLRVDAVNDVVRLAPSALEAIPSSLGPRNAGFLLGLGRVGARLFILLDVQAVLNALAVAAGIPEERTKERVQ
jgi:purine-binding chemotaxis protein CheW